MSVLWQIGDAITELSRLLSQAIVFPGARRKVRRAGQVPLVPAGAAVTKDNAGGAMQAPGLEAARGHLVLIGGTRLGDDVVLEMIRLAGGRSARILIVPTAHLDFTRGGERYARSFRRFGAQRVERADIVTRRRADDAALAARLAEADLIFLGGGDVGLFLDLLAGTEALAALRSARSRGATIAGICGGASVLGEAVVREADGEPVGGPRVEPGLGLLDGVVVDAQMSCGGRLGRLLQAVAGGTGAGRVPPPGAAGLAIEEDTAVIVGPDRVGRVIGSGMALVVTQDALDTAPGHLPRLALHVLPAGHRYDFARQQPLPSTSTDPAAREAR